jgi:hypothetical protein
MERGGSYKFRWSVVKQDIAAMACKSQLHVILSQTWIRMADILP